MRGGGSPIPPTKPQDLLNGASPLRRGMRLPMRSNLNKILQVMH